MSLSFDPEVLRVLAELLKRPGCRKSSWPRATARCAWRGPLAPVNVPVMAPRAAPRRGVPLPADPVVKADPAKHPGVVKSPMVGAAYLFAEPGAAPYVSAGRKRGGRGRPCC